MKTSTFLRRLTALLALAALALSLLSCGGGAAVMEYDGQSISEAEFQYYLATYKSRFAQTYSDFRDNEAFYRQPIGDTTAEDFLFDAVVHNVSLSLVCDGLFKEYGLSLPRAVVNDVDAYIDSYLEDYAGGSKNSFNQALANYGINMKMLREIYLRDERATAVYNYLYGANGTIGLNDAERTAYLEANYARVRHIYVNNKTRYATDENGEAIIGSDGHQQEVPLTGADLDAKNALVAAIDEALAEGGDFEEIYRVSSEDQYYPHGYYLTRDMDFIEGVVSSAFELAIGEWVKVESDRGVHYIMRLPLEERPWDEEDCKDFFENYDETVTAELFTSMLEEKFSGITYHDDVLSQYSVEASPINSRF
ncbi:MAG: hypothetical protein II836_03495 [Clostridia bacterium]|nr:hypothetical protein [Clostridia bacterium]